MTSVGVLDYLIQLQESGYAICPVRGNHEEMLLNAVADPAECSIWYGNGGWATLKEFGVATPSAIPHRYLDFISALPYVITTHDFIFAHAGLDFLVNDPLQDTPFQFMLWARDYKVDPAKIGGRTLVTGHTVVPLFAIRKSLSTHKKSRIYPFKIFCGSFLSFYGFLLCQLMVVVTYFM